jgi:hypothetical protein
MRLIGENLARRIPETLFDYCRGATCYIGSEANYAFKQLTTYENRLNF